MPLRRGVQHYVIKFVSDLLRVDGFLRVLLFHLSLKTDRHDISKILLKVELIPIIHLTLDTYDFHGALK